MLPLEIVIPLLVVGVAFLAYCYVDIARIPATRYLPKWAWCIVCIISIPLGGIAYLLVGRTAKVGA
jgi:hypothetical protein